jgi:hypothetical protein
MPAFKILQTCWMRWKFSTQGKPILWNLTFAPLYSPLSFPPMRGMARRDIWSVTHLQALRM